MAKVIAIFVTCLFFAITIQAEEEASNAKQGKVFSLFSIVTFKNMPCTSQSGTSGAAGTNRNGTCYTSTECVNRGGASSGNCAAGFGVCCIFIISAGSTITSNNSTYIQNPGFPTVYSATTALSYTVKKCSNDICMLRLDFNTLTLEGLTANDDSGLCKDTFAVTTSPLSNTYPLICGKNSGYHMYVDMGRDATSTATLSFSFGTAASTLRTWEIKVTQISCSSLAKPYDNACLQYFTGITGRIESYNFLEPTAALQVHLPSQRYTNCIRQERGYCCIQYQVCSDTNSYNFALPAITMAKHGSDCSLDYIGIQGGSQTCDNGPMSGSAIHPNRFCGKYFSGIVLAAIDNTPVCSCLAPFGVQINFDANPAAAAEAAPQRGVCLNYQQIPCP